MSDVDGRGVLSRIGRLLRAPRQTAFHDLEEVFGKLIGRLDELSPLPRSDWRILDVGCGYTYPNLILFANQGVDIHGLDIVGAFYRDGLLARWRSEAELPLAGRIGHVAQARGFRWLYYRHLSRLARLRIDHASLQLHGYEGGRFPFEEQAFNIVISNAALEHVADLALFAGEVRRVLEPTGVADIVWHNYYSWSGNHLPDSVNLAHPWGHLTGETTPPANAALNEAPPETIEQAFAERFEVVRCMAADAQNNLAGEAEYQAEAQEMLTGELRESLLAEYPEELLLARAFLMQLRAANDG